MKQFLQDHSLRGLAARHSRLAGFLACLAIFALIVGWSAHEVTHAVIQARDAKTLTQRIQRESERTTSALCALRLDIELRVRGAQDFLAAHPHGFGGISATAMRDNIANQQRTAAALSGLSCSY